MPSRKGVDPLLNTHRSPSAPDSRSCSHRLAGFVLLSAALMTAFLLTATLADAAPVEVRLRIEGRTKTLFEGPIMSEGHRIKAASDRQWRRCDSTNNGMNPSPGPTPTAAADDAMRLLGLDFDASWYPGFEDYFLERFGPDRQNEDRYEYWGILVNSVFTSVGGCQQQLKSGDEAFWAYNAFNDRPFLHLSAQTNDNSVDNPEPPLPPAPIVAVDPGDPIQLTVRSYTGGQNGTGQQIAPRPGLQVREVVTEPRSFFQSVSGPVAGVTNTYGSISVMRSTPGWYRFKVEDEANYVRSNRVDVCVGECGALPADVEVRTPPPLPDIEQPPVDQPPAGGDAPAGGDTGQSTEAPQLRRPVIVTGPNRTGRVGVKWAVRNPGVGLRSWSIDSYMLGQGRARWVTRARGGPQRQAAAFRLPAGVSHRLRFTVIDNLGRSARFAVGQVAVPIDAAGRQVRLRGPWVKQRDRGAWMGSVQHGRAGATARVRLRPGRPLALVRGSRRPARVAMISGGRRQVFAVSRGRANQTRQVIGPRLRRPGIIELRVLAGTIRFDGFSTRP